MRQVAKITLFLFTILVLQTAYSLPLVEKPSYSLSSFGSQVEVGNLLLLVGSPARQFTKAQKLCADVKETDDRFDLVRVSQLSKKAKEFRAQMGNTWVWALDDRNPDSLELKPVGVQVTEELLINYLPENSVAALWATLHAVCGARNE